MELPKQFVIYFSHGNCQKIHQRQLDVAKNIAEQLKKARGRSAGIMAESFLIEGTQQVIAGKSLTYSQSITDPCLGWQDTEQLLTILADTVKHRF